MVRCRLVYQYTVYAVIMYKVVNIGDHAVPMKATAATQYRFKTVFGTDMMSVLSKAYADKDSRGDVAELIPKLGFIMAKQAEGEKNWTSINVQDFYEWAEQFDSTAMNDALLEILFVYNANTQTTATPKNREGAPSGK